MFKNRKHAGEILAAKLTEDQPNNPLVIGIPRGGIETAAPLAEKLGAPLYVIQPRKIGAPFHPEYAVGALAPDGTVTLDETALASWGLTHFDLERVIEKEKQELEKRLHLYGRWSILPDLSEHTIILVDDGIATGHTVRAALSSLKKKTSNSVVLAVPVLPLDAVPLFRELADKLYYLEAPAYFQAVGQFYDDFSDLSHEDILDLLEKTNSSTTNKASCRKF